MKNNCKKKLVRFRIEKVINKKYDKFLNGKVMMIDLIAGLIKQAQYRY